MEDNPNPRPIDEVFADMLARDGDGVEPEAIQFMAELAATVRDKVAQPEQAIAVLLLTSIGMLGEILKHEDQKSRRGKLVNTMTDEYRRLLQKYLPQI